MLFICMILLWEMPWVSGSHALRNSHTYRDLYLPCNSSLCQMFILPYPSSQALTHFVRFTHSPCLLLHGPMSTGDTVAPFRISDERSHHEPRCINDNWTIRYLLTIVTSPAAQERRGMPFLMRPFYHRSWLRGVGQPLFVYQLRQVTDTPAHRHRLTWPGS